MYKLFVGFIKLGEFPSILEAKKFANQSGYSGVFNLLGEDYSDSWCVYKHQNNDESMMTITDITGKIIEVTDLDEAIKECEFCVDSPYKMPSGYTVGENHRFMLKQLLKLKQEQKKA